MVTDNLHGVDYSDLEELRRDGNSLEMSVKFYSSYSTDDRNLLQLQIKVSEM